MEMRNGIDHYFIFTHLIDDTVSKAPQTVTPDAVSQRMPSVRQGDDLLKTGLELIEEFRPQPCLRSIIVFNSFPDLDPRRGLDSPSHGLRGNRNLSSAKTSSTGTPFVSPRS